MREIATDELGNVLWSEEYRFRSLSAPGEHLVRDSIGYVVVSSEVRDGAILTVVRRAAPEPHAPMTRDQLLADLSRAARTCFPERAEQIIREIEVRLTGACTNCRKRLYATSNGDADHECYECEIRRESPHLADALIAAKAWTG